MKLSVPQKTVAQDETRFRVLVGGRRFGKTTLAIRELCYHARKPNQTCWYVSPSYRMSRQIAWEQIKRILYKLNWIQKTNEAELVLTLKNNSKICLRGADNADSLRGVGINFLVMDDQNKIDWIDLYGFILVAFAHMTDWYIADSELQVISDKMEFMISNTNQSYNPERVAQKIVKVINRYNTFTEDNAKIFIKSNIKTI